MGSVRGLCRQQPGKPVGPDPHKECDPLEICLRRTYRGKCADIDYRGDRDPVSEREAADKAGEDQRQRV